MKSIRLSDLSAADIEKMLQSEGLGLQIGAFRCLIHSDTGLLAQPLHLLYHDYQIDAAPAGFYDFRIHLRKTRDHFWQGWKAEFDWDGNSPFPALPLAQAHPLFEWGLNWCVATASGMHTVIHSAVVERNGLALVLPGQPGSGKSTLCAALSFSGWRLLSDELTVVSQKTGEVQAFPRPISLKGASIDLVRQHFVGAALTVPVGDTHKGSIAYARAPAAAVEAVTQSASIGYIVFPKFRAGTELAFEKLSRAKALTELLDNTFNVGLLGEEGFVALARAIEEAQCYAVEYGDLASIVSWIESICQPV